MSQETISPLLFAAITGQVIDTAANPWGFCIIQFSLFVPSGQKPIDLTTGQPIPTPPPIVANVTGNFTASLQTNATIVPGSQWQMTIFPFNNQRNGQTLLPFTVLGAMNLSAAIASQLRPAVDTPLILPMSNSGATGQSPLNGSMYFDIEANDLFIKSPSGGGYIPIGGGPANAPTLNQILPATANTVLDTEFFTLQIQGTPPAAGAGTGGGGQFATINANTGQGTTGTTGQVGGVGGDLSLGGGNGGNAPAGSTNGGGGNVFVNGGRAGNGPGGAGAHGNCVIQQSGGITQIGGNTSATSLQVNPNGITTAQGAPVGAAFYGNTASPVPVRIVCGSVTLVAGSGTVNFLAPFTGTPIVSFGVVGNGPPGNAAVPYVWIISATNASMTINASSATATNAVEFIAIGPAT